MTDALRDRVIVAVGEQYDIQAELGRGGMAVVYRALDLRLHRHVAVKVLPPELAQDPKVRTRFLREAQMAAQLSHPNVVPIYDMGERQGIAWLVMALVDGETLAQRLTREPRPPIAEVVRILAETADALGAAHRRGIVHRDVKPDNILLERATGTVRVTDFGIARATEAGQTLTVTGVAMGTPAYMSPEQALGERTLDGRSDLYSLAVVGYLMITGELPFAASNAAALLMKHVSDMPLPLSVKRPDVPRALETALMRALAKEPSARWPDASSFRDALYAAIAPPPPAPAEPSPPAAWPRAVRVPPEAAAFRRGGEQAPAGASAGDAELRREQERRAREAEMIERESKARARQVPVPIAPPPPLPVAPPVRAPKGRESAEERYASLPEEHRIASFRRKLVGSGVVMTMLGGINAATSPDFPWFLIPSFFMTADLARRAGWLWADGISLRRVFSRNRQAGAEDAPKPAAGAKAKARVRAVPIPPPPASVTALATPEILAGAQGDAVRRALEHRNAVLELVAGLPVEDRALLPDVAPTVDALCERVASLASTLHRLDESLAAAPTGESDARLARVRAEPESPERERRLALLERQRETIQDLANRRATLASRLDSAALALENLRLDLVRLRSAGLRSAIDDVTQATQEARALSRDIGSVLEVADELRSSRGR